MEIVSFKVLTLLVRALWCKRPHIMDPDFFNSFSNTNLSAWLSDFFSQNSLKYYHKLYVFKHLIETMILLSKSIAKNCVFVLEYIEATYPVFASSSLSEKKNGALRDEGKVFMPTLNYFSDFFSKK